MPAAQRRCAIVNTVVLTLIVLTLQPGCPPLQTGDGSTEAGKDVKQTRVRVMCSVV